ncbi:hypothetical protein D3C73_899700 [compost metagenome]
MLAKYQHIPALDKRPVPARKITMIMDRRFGSGNIQAIIWINLLFKNIPNRQDFISSLEKTQGTFDDSITDSKKWITHKEVGITIFSSQFFLQACQLTRTQHFHPIFFQYSSKICTFKIPCFLLLRIHFCEIFSCICNITFSIGIGEKTEIFRSNCFWKSKL